MRSALQWLARAAMAIVGLVLLGALAYMIHGSLELHPTDEQQGKIRLVLGLVIAAAAGLEFLLWAYIKRRR